MKIDNRCRLVVAVLLLSGPVVGQKSVQSPRKARAHSSAQNMTLSPLIQQVSFSLVQGLTDAVQEGNDASAETTIKVTDEEIERLLEFDVKTPGDLHLVEMVSNASSMASEYFLLLSLHEYAKANDALSVIDCLQDIRSAISDRKYKSDGRCKTPERIKQAMEKPLHPSH
jgi:hypothetical protein